MENQCDLLNVHQLSMLTPTSLAQLMQLANKNLINNSQQQQQQQQQSAVDGLDNDQQTHLLTNALLLTQQNLIQSTLSNALTSLLNENTAVASIAAAVAASSTGAVSTSISDHEPLTPPTSTIADRMDSPTNSLFDRTPSPNGGMLAAAHSPSSYYANIAKSFNQSSSPMIGSDMAAPLDLSLNLRNSPPPPTRFKTRAVKGNRTVGPASKRRPSSTTVSDTATTTSTTTTTVSTNSTIMPTTTITRRVTNNNHSATGLIRVLDSQLGISRVSLSSLSPNSCTSTSPAPRSPKSLDGNSSVLDSPPTSEPNSDQDQDQACPSNSVTKNASTSANLNSENTFRMLDVGQLNAALLEPEVIISTDPLDDEPAQGGGSQMKRKLDAMVNNSTFLQQSSSSSPPPLPLPTSSSSSSSLQTNESINQTAMAAFLASLQCPQPNSSTPSIVSAHAGSVASPTSAIPPSSLMTSNTINTVRSISNIMNSGNNISIQANGRRRQFGQLSLLSPHVENVSNGHLVVAPDSNQRANGKKSCAKKRSALVASPNLLSPGASLLLDDHNNNQNNNNNNNNHNNNSSCSSASSFSTTAETVTPPPNFSLDFTPDYLNPIPSTSSSDFIMQNSMSFVDGCSTTTQAGSFANIIIKSTRANPMPRAVGIKSPNGQMMFPCDLCDQSFSAPDRLNKHKASRHKDEKQLELLASMGPNAFVMSQSVKKHKPFRCSNCTRAFSRSDMLTRHYRLHSGTKPYTCDHCSQVFSRSDHLATHKRTHSGEKPYQCSQCGYAACRRDMITRHQKTHLNEEKKKAAAAIVAAKKAAAVAARASLAAARVANFSAASSSSSSSSSRSATASPPSTSPLPSLARASSSFSVITSAPSAAKCSRTKSRNSYRK